MEFNITSNNIILLFETEHNNSQRASMSIERRIFIVMQNPPVFEVIQTESFTKALLATTYSNKQTIRDNIKCNK